DGEPELAEAYVYVVEDPAATRLVPRGLDRTHAIVFATGDVAPGTATADYLGGPITAGFHMRHWAVTATPGAGQRAMIDRCIASGALRAACEVRRAYQLAPVPDDDPLLIMVTP